MRYIDADKLKSEFDYKHIDMNKTTACVHHKNILEIINQQPTADVVQVVRCRDCKFYTFKPQQTSRTTSVRRCNRSAIVCTKPDDYCSFGERGTHEKDN